MEGDDRVPAITSIFESERLLYRAIDVEKDEVFFAANRSNSVALQLANSSLQMPPTKDTARRLMEKISNEYLLAVVICPKVSDTKDANPEVPIGYLHLSKSVPSYAQHRHTELGIHINGQYQGKGYGGEAIEWAVAWAFQRAGMHKVELGTSQYNVRGRHLYAKLGFVLEGRLREHVWHDGRFWDYFMYGLLAAEWREQKLPSK